MSGVDLVKNIKKYGKLKGYSISEIESKLGFSTGLISRWKNVSPSIDKIIEISRLLETPIDVLVGIDEDAEPAFDPLSQQSVEKLIKLTKKGQLEWREFYEDINIYPKIQNYLALMDTHCNKACYCKYHSGYFIMIIHQSETKSTLLLFALADINLDPYTIDCSRELLILLLQEADGDLYTFLNESVSEGFLQDLINS